MQPWENIKRHKVKQYGFKTSNSDEVRQGCLHFFTISRSLASRRNQPKKNTSAVCLTREISFFSFPFSFSFSLTDKDHPQATTCKPIYHSKQLSVTSVLILVQTKCFGKLCRSVVLGDEVGTNLFFV